MTITQSLEVTSSESPLISKMAGLVNATYGTYRHIFHDLPDRRTDDWFLMGSPWFPVTILILYIYLVKVVGPRFMKGKPAFNLDKIIAVYNIAQICACSYVVIASVSTIWNKKYSFFCEPVDYSNSEDAIYISRIPWAYYILKVVDLMETGFFILRKKDSQVTFLHVYHHTGMVIVSWLTTRYAAGGDTVLGGGTNCFVHVVMYSYYFVTNMWPEYKRHIWWKKYITQLQMFQFAFLFVHYMPSVILKDCNYPAFIGGLLCLLCFIFMILFSNFYRKAYRKRKTT